MGKVKRLQLWWKLYRTSLPVRDLENFRPMDFCWTEYTIKALNCNVNFTYGSNIFGSVSINANAITVTDSLVLFRNPKNYSDILEILHFSCGTQNSISVFTAPTHYHLSRNTIFLSTYSDHISFSSGLRVCFHLWLDLSGFKTLLLYGKLVSYAWYILRLPLRLLSDI